MPYNVFERECDAISGRNGKNARNYLTPTIKYIVMQMRKGNYEKGYWLELKLNNRNWFALNLHVGQA